MLQLDKEENILLLTFASNGIILRSQQIKEELDALYDEEDSAMNSINKKQITFIIGAYRDLMALADKIYQELIDLGEERCKEERNYISYILGFLKSIETSIQ